MGGGARESKNGTAASASRASLVGDVSANWLALLIDFRKVLLDVVLRAVQGNLLE